MCGIAGIIRHGELRSDIVPILWKTHAERGPDDRGYLALRGGSTYASQHWDPGDAGSDVLLVHNRLAVIDLSQGGWQPMSSPDLSTHVVFNGEIYNYLELRAELDTLGHVFSSSSDTEVLLAAYAQWGKDAIPKLVGMFAFAILDLNRRVLFLVRDFFGIKPLFYSHTPVGFVFGSTIRSILEAAPGQRHANPPAVFDFLRFGISDDSRATMIQGISHLPPAHHMEVSIDHPCEVQPTRYWKPGAASLHDVSFSDAASLLRDEFIKSVGLHLRSDVSVGTALSGGIDSSSITMTMRELVGSRMDLHAFSFIPNDAYLSEERWIDLVGRAAQATVHKVRPTMDELLSELPAFIDSQGEPAGSLSPLVQRYVFRLAKQSGVKVMLDGQGADEILGGYTSYLGARLASLLRRGRLASGIMLLQSSSRLRSISPLHIVSNCGPFLLPGPLARLARHLVGRDIMPDWVNAQWFDSAPTTASNENRSRSRSVLTSELKHSVQRDLPGLLRYEDCNSMAFSIESRVPFLTPKLVDLALSLPEHYLISNSGESKSVFRAAMRGIVPDQILGRQDKIGFDVPQREWLRQIRSSIVSTLSSPTAQAIGVLNVPRIKKLGASFLDGHGEFGNELWRAVNLVEWAHRYEVTF